METLSNRDGVRPTSVLIVIGGVCVVLGGLVAAVTRPLDLVHGSWLAAYLVLVCGVAQFAIGTMQAAGATDTHRIPPVRGWVQLACLTLGNVGVVVGTVTGMPLVVDTGGVFLVIAFGIALQAARPRAQSTIRGGVAGLPVTRPVGRVFLWAYRGLLVLLVISIPVGSVLARFPAR